MRGSGVVGGMVAAIAVVRAEALGDMPINGSSGGSGGGGKGVMVAAMASGWARGGK